MEPLASLGLSEVWASPEVSESVPGHWSHLPLKDHLNFQPTDQGTCPGSFPELSLASGAPEVFQRCQKGCRVLSEIPPLFYSWQVAPRAGHCLCCDKSPQNGMGVGGLCILVLPCALPVWFLASHSTSPSFRFLICKMGQEGINSLMCIQCLAYSKCLE